MAPLWSVQDSSCPARSWQRAGLRKIPDQRRRMVMKWMPRLLMLTAKIIDELGVELEPLGILARKRMPECDGLISSPG